MLTTSPTPKADLSFLKWHYPSFGTTTNWTVITLDGERLKTCTQMSGTIWRMLNAMEVQHEVGLGLDEPRESVAEHLRFLQEGNGTVVTFVVIDTDRNLQII